LYLEVATKLWHPTIAEGMESLNEELKLYYSANRHLHLSSVYPLSITQLKSRTDPFPSLKAKAAQCRHLGEFALALAYKHKHGTVARPPFRFAGRLRGHEQEHLENLVGACEGMCRFHRSCKAQPFDAEACKAAMYRCLQCLSALHRLWRQGLPESEQGHQPFAQRPKAHELQHLVEDKLPLWGSPSSFWCYRDEDFIGAVKIIASKSNHPHTLEKRVMEKLIILATLGFAP
jgi:hypothetical protein